MKRTAVRAALLGLTAALLGRAALAAEPSAAPELPIPPIAFRARVLDNGLRVIAVERRATPTVAVQVWYHVGSRDDPPGRSGFAHLFEHMMFKATRNLADEQFDRLTEDVGGANNAFTSDDVTAYQSVVPANHLETLLWAEAERMANLRVDAANFRSERAVVQEEYRQQILAAPYGRFFNAIPGASYRVHPYRRTTIGSIEDLDAAELADVVAFHAAHYRPDNATLVVAGDFDPAQLDAWVDRYFGHLPRPPAAPARAPADEPPWPADRRVDLAAPRVPLPAVALTWLAPPLTHPDAAALRVAAAILANGDSSRLNQALVYRQQVASQAGFDADLRVGPGLLIGYAIAAGDSALERVRAALLTEVKRLIAQPPHAAELAKVKTQLITAAFMTRQTALGLGAAVAEAAVLEGDPARVNASLDDLRRVSAADVQRVLRRYVAGAHHVTIAYRQAPAAR
ncbi:M16 family metallopeptidase [Piscinibacter koreensis]|uniref:M16 family metallopeptidase n=1 Tax=Piscinibacter koreensis TaxID=2742824 RepID=UPI001C375E5A